MSEGGTYASLRQRYTAALSAGENSLRALLGSSSSSWKLLQTVTPKAASLNGNEAILSKTENSEDSVSGISANPIGPIVIHRKKAKGAPDVVRAVCTVPLTDPVNALDSFRAVLNAESIREKWDPVVERQEVLEVVEPAVTLVRTFTRIGWPSSARDVVTVNKFLQEPGKTLIYLSVSLPRSSGKTNDDPPFLQPSPPYIRSHMHICAFVITCPTPNKAKLSMYWQWDLKGSSVIWTNHLTAMPKIVSSLVDYSQNQAPRIPYVKSWGKGVTFESEAFDPMQDRLDLHYGIFVEEAVDDHDRNHVLLEKSKERRRLERTVEICVPPVDQTGAGWNITLPPSGEGAEPDWQILAERGRLTSDSRSRIVLRISHNAPKEDYSAVHVILQRLAGGKSLKINGEPLQIADVEERDPTAFTARTINTPMSPSLVKPNASVLSKVNGLDATCHASVTTADTRASSRDEKVSQAQMDLLLHIRRSYAHFLSLLQSPAAKWRNLNDIRRVSISSYIAIDPAMTPIYKYEATFVNTTMWDLLSIFTSSGSRLIWDKHSGLERFQLLGELEVDTMDGDMNPNDQSAGEGRASFWEAGWKAMWPTAAREAVFVRTTYRSPTSIHLLQTSVPEDEDAIWRTFSDKISPSSEGTFRLHSQLQSVAFDQISPTTTSVVLVDQTNPKSWTKSGYNTMANAIANMGEMVLKEGAPPLLTHLAGATLTASSYNHESTTSEIQYLPKQNRKVAGVESVLRLDLEVWSPAGVSLLIQPPPSRISALARHRLSEKGSGCWITIEHHDMTIAKDSDVASKISVTIQKGNDSAISDAPGRNSIMVNGEKLRVDLEELQDSEIQARRLQKRVVNRAVMLDRSPTPRNTAHFGRPPSIAEIAGADTLPLARSATPLNIAEKTPSVASPITTELPTGQKKAPLDYAFDALASLQSLYKESSDARSEATDWTILSYAENNLPIRISRRSFPIISAELPLYRVERTLPNVSEEQLLRLIQATSSNLRTSWDDRLSSIERIAQYENGFSTNTWIAQSSFPTRARIAYVASVRAQEHQVTKEATDKKSAVVYVASASILVTAFEHERRADRAIVAAERLNPSRLLEAKIPLEGWVIETSSSSKDDDDDDAEPQTYTKCSFFTCSDIPLMIPGAFGQAALRTRLARMFDTLEKLSKIATVGAIPRLPRPAVRLAKPLAPAAGQPRRWGIKHVQRHSTIIAAMPSSIVLKIYLPSNAQVTANGVHDADGASILNGSAISQRSLGLQNLENAAENSSRRSVAGSDNGSNVREVDANDVVLAELVLSREAGVSGYDIRSTVTLPGDKILPTDTSFWDKLSPVPFTARVYPAAGSAKVPSQYLLKISLPTAQFTSPMDHPLSSLSGSPRLPRWYRKLGSEAGMVHLQATPIKAASRPDGMPLAHLRFRLDGADLPLATDHVTADTSTTQITGPDNESLDELVLLNSDTAEREVDTTSARLPVMVNTAFLKHAPSRHKDALQSPGLASPPLLDELAPVTEQEHSEAEASAGKFTSKTRQPLVDLFTATTVVHHGVEGQPGAHTVSVRTYRLAFVILVAVISFLLGSLLRSLLSPGDYIFFTRPLDSMEAAVWELLNPQKKWKFATRLLQIHVPGIKRDFVAALVEND